jgi:hypothetical protein
MYTIAIVSISSLEKPSIYKYPEVVSARNNNKYKTEKKAACAAITEPIFSMLRTGIALSRAPPNPQNIGSK